MHHVKNWKYMYMLTCPVDWLYKLTTGNFVTNKTLFTTFQKSHWLKFARCLCKLSQFACQPQTSEDGQSQYCTTSKTSVHHPHGMYLSYFLARLWAVGLGRRWELAFLVEETAGVFTTNLSMSKFLSVFNERNYILPKSWQLCLFFLPILPTNISQSNE